MTELPQPSQRPVEEKHLSKLLVFLFSLVPGAGHMYLGLMTRGIQLMTLFFGAIYIAFTVGHPVEEMIPVFVGPVLWFYSFFDSLQTAGRITRGEKVEDRALPIFLQQMQWGRTAGVVLVVLGSLALLNSLGVWIPGLSTFVRRLMGPGLLLGIGMWLLLRPNHLDGYDGPNGSSDANGKDPAFETDTETTPEPNIKVETELDASHAREGQ